MIRLVVRVIGSHSDDDRESTLSKVETHQYDPDHLENQIAVAIDQAIQHLRGGDEKVLVLWRPEVSISLSVNNEAVRPSLHISASLIARLCKAQASLDFDPYV